MRTKSTFLLILAGCSGVFGINYEVLYFRLITARFGDMIHVQAGILAMFLLGVAIGARAGAKLRRLWLLELLVGVTAIAVGTSLPAIETAPWLGWVLQHPIVAAALCMLLVAVPAILIGCSVPLFTEYLAMTSAEGQDGPFRRVYGIYNLGAAASVLATEFFLVRVLGNATTLHVLAAGNIWIGLILFLLFPELRGGQLRPREAGAADTLDRHTAAGLVLIGCASSLYQMAFVRGAMEILGNTRGIFALTLALVMVGFPLGVRLSRRLNLAGVVHLATVAIVVGFSLLPFLQRLHSQWFALAPTTGLGSVGGRVVWQLLMLIPVGLPPFICFGAVLPVLLRNRSGNVHLVGRAMFLNGIGNAAGFILFVAVVNDLFPELGHLLTAIALAQLGVFLALGRGAYRRGPANPYPLAAAASLVVLLATFSSEAYYAHHMQSRAGYRWDDDLTQRATMALHMEREGATNAGVIRFRDADSLEGKLLFYSGHSSIFAIERGQVNRAEVLSGVLPALVAPSRRRAAVIGIGTGITAGTTALLFDRTDAVEINPAVLALLPRFADANFNLATNPKAHVVYNDARIFLATSPPVYDVIVNSVSVPSFEAASKIYTTEFFARAKRALVDGGVYMTWVAMNDAALAAVVASLRRSFRHCGATYLSRGYLMLACADRPIRPRRLESVSIPEPVAAVLQQYGRYPAAPSEVIAGLHLSDDFLATLPKGGAENTDDKPEAEYAFGDPRVPATLLTNWPRKHPQFVARDLRTGQPLPGAAIWRRCSLYAEHDLREVCDSLPSRDPEFITAMLADSWPPAAGVARERVAALQARRRLLERLLDHGIADPALRGQRDSVVLVLADLVPDDGEVQAAASTVLDRAGENPLLAKLRRYRAIALDPRFRRYVSPEARRAGGAREGGANAR